MRAVRAAALVAGLVITAGLGAAAPAAAAEADVVVDSQAGWVAVPVTPDQGYWVNETGGSWTVDHRSVPYTRASGYSSRADRAIWQGCKVLDGRYGALLGRIGPHGAPFTVGHRDRVIADGSGLLYLRINDADHCLGDNAGAITVSVR